MADLREELLAEVGPKTHVADLCRRAMQDINMKAARIAVLEAELERMRQDRKYIIGWNDGYEHANKENGSG